MKDKRNCIKGIERELTVASPRLQYRVADPQVNAQHHIANRTARKRLRRYLASGWHTLRSSRRDLTGKIPLSDGIVGRLPHRLTWVWRKRGIASLESDCEIESYVARCKNV